MTNQKRMIFTGAATAIVTPFKNNKIDFDAFGKLIELQINGGIDAIVVCGTTGECATLSDEEHRDSIRFAVEKVAGRIPVIAGTGSNDTDYMIKLSKEAEDIGADALLLVTPYYNKASQKGLVKSFTAVADAVKLPIILYNVPSRTGVNIALSTYKELAKHENIVAVKEASGNIGYVAEIAAELSDSLTIYSGNDDQIVPLLSLGGKGVISVLSNIMPRETHEICALWNSGKVTEARDLQLRLLPLINALFCEVNPIPVKTAMGMLGLCSDEMRLPLCEMEPQNKARLKTELDKVFKSI